MMHLYRALLRAYPASFRAEYGEDMTWVFARRRKEARGVFGLIALWTDALRDVFTTAIPAHLDILRQDLRYTVRTLLRAPGFAATAILVAGLGIGANTAVFTVADYVLVRPLPFRDSDRLIKIWESPGGCCNNVSPANWRDWRSMSRSFSSLAAYNNVSVNLAGHGEPVRVEGAAVTADLLPSLGVQPLLGRFFAPEEDRPGAAGAALLSYRLWQRNFGGDPTVLGRKILLDDGPYVVIGVMPRTYNFPSRTSDIWTAARYDDEAFDDRTNTYLHVIGRLAPGVTFEQARAEMRIIAERLERAYPNENAEIGVQVNRLQDEITNQTRLLLKVLLAAAVCVLLIACTNLANLLLARTIVRRQELAVRSSLGAGRDRLVRQLLTESMVLALLGGLAGIGIALLGLPLLARLVPETLPIAEMPSIDLRVLSFALGLTVLTGVGFGVVPALRACREASMAGLRDSARSGGGRRERLRSVLVMVEVMASVVLLIGAGLLIRALWELQSRDPGFRTEGVLTLRTWLPWPKYIATEKRVQFYDRVLEEARALPGVSSAAYVSFLPMAMGGGIWPVIMPGEPVEPGRQPMASLRFATPGFFATMGIPIRQGRDLSEADTRDQPFVAVVSESFVTRHWPGQNPLGKRFEFGLAERTVVGVVGDIRVRGLERRSEPQVYLSYKQVQDSSLVFYPPKDLVVRAGGDPTALVPALRRIIRGTDPEQAISDVRLLSAVVDGDTAPRQTQVRVLGVFAAIAFLLAAIGIHGLLSFSVSQRSHEIGVRMALGAQARDIVRMVLREGVMLGVVGVVLGASLGYVAARAMRALLVGIAPADVTTFLAAIVLALVMTVAGSLAPALRAVRVDPTTVIRSG
ncbi:MAG TPA: ABC transporter permease [Gemmatimonadaceae bacterium]|nr:ABC transporter permease [Gemmatimonadaceae bacterium]